LASSCIITARVWRLTAMLSCLSLSLIERGRFLILDNDRLSACSCACVSSVGGRGIEGGSADGRERERRKKRRRRGRRPKVPRRDPSATHRSREWRGGRPTAGTEREREKQGRRRGQSRGAATGTNGRSRKRCRQHARRCALAPCSVSCVTLCVCVCPCARVSHRPCRGRRRET